MFKFYIFFYFIIFFLGGGVYKKGGDTNFRMYGVYKYAFFLKFTSLIELDWLFGDILESQRD